MLCEQIDGYQSAAETDLKGDEVTDTEVKVAEVTDSEVKDVVDSTEPRPRSADADQVRVSALLSAKVEKVNRRGESRGPSAAETAESTRVSQVRLVGSKEADEKVSELRFDDESAASGRDSSADGTPPPRCTNFALSLFTDIYPCDAMLARVLAMTLCPSVSVCLSVCHKSVRLDRLYSSISDNRLQTNKKETILTNSTKSKLSSGIIHSLMYQTLSVA